MQSISKGESEMSDKYNHRLLVYHLEGINYSLLSDFTGFALAARNA